MEDIGRVKAKVFTKIFKPLFDWRGPYLIYYSIPCSVLLKPVWPICYSIKHSLALAFCIFLLSVWNALLPDTLVDPILRSLFSSHLSVKSLFSYHPILNSHLSPSTPDQFSLCLIFLPGIHYHLFFFSLLSSLKFLRRQRWVCSVLFTPIAPLTQMEPGT